LLGRREGAGVNQKLTRKREKMANGKQTNEPKNHVKQKQRNNKEKQ